MREGWRRPMWQPLAGAVLALGAAPAMIVVPELAAPVVFLALRLLATRYTWADRADRRLQELFARGRRWWRARSLSARQIATTGVLVLLVTAGWGTLGLVA
ncbi:MAG: hypothetical protein L0H84_09670 [Pseudonocardia sp.]|nr:hypothetical protein [Pseudonocardia sp.]